MATATLISIDEYLHSRYEPDADYVDGVVEERPIGELDHNRIQKRLLLLLSVIDAEAHFECIQEQRVRVSPTRFRIPDLCLLCAGAEEQVTIVPPLLCIEVLSPEDTMPRTMTRARDFLAMGVPQVWIVDPARLTVHLCSGSIITVQTEGILEVPETPITLSIEDIFSALDKKSSK